MAQFEIHRDIDAPVDRVWEVISDHEGMPRWTALERATLVRPGEGDRNGLGAVRRLVGPGPAIVEEVVAWDPPSAFEYRLDRGLPVRDYRASVRLSEHGGKTRVTWSASFRPKLPGTGWLLSAAMKKAFAGALKGLARFVERGG